MSLASSATTERKTPLSFDVSSLLGKQRYVWIKHQGDTYLLQLTKNNKLLLTK